MVVQRLPQALERSVARDEHAVVRVEAAGGEHVREAPAERGFEIAVVERVGGDDAGGGEAREDELFPSRAEARGLLEHALGCGEHVVDHEVEAPRVAGEEGLGPLDGDLDAELVERELAACDLDDLRVELHPGDARGWAEVPDRARDRAASEAEHEHGG